MLLAGAKIPKSDLFFYFFLAFAIGIFSGSSNNWLFFLLIIPLLYFFAKRSNFKKSFLLVIFIVLSAATGVFYCRFYISSQNGNSSMLYSGAIIKNIAFIYDDTADKNSIIEIKARIQDSGEKILIVSKKSALSLKYGDKIMIEGKISVPKIIGDFDYGEYLAKEGIFFVAYYPKIEILESGGGNAVKRRLFDFKNKFGGNLSMIYPEPAASFANGLLFGNKISFPSDFKEKLKLTGTSHIMAVSGYNITIISKYLMFILVSLGIIRPKAFWMAVLGILFFVVLTGASASVVRAGIMGILFLLARYSGQLYGALNSLFAAAFVMVILNPLILYFDVAFGLSFLATMGLIFLLPYFENKFGVNKEGISVLKKEFLSIIAATLSAQIMVLGFLIYKFKTVSLLSLLSNILILPAIPFSMFVGFIAGILGFISVSLSEVFSWLSVFSLQYSIFIIDKLSRVPFASLEIHNFSWIFLIIYYLVIAVFTYKANKERAM